MVMFYLVFKKIEYVKQDNGRSLTEGKFQIDNDFLVNKIVESG